MTKIEFLGFSGVGKTTLLNHIRTNNKELCWQLDTEALISVVKKHFTTTRLISRRKLIDLDILKSNHVIWAREILWANRYEIYETLEKYNIWLKFFIENFHSLENTTARDKLEYTELFFRRIREVCTLDHYKAEGVIIWDEGIFQNNHSIENMPSFIEFSKTNKQKLLDVSPQGIIYCHLSGEENFKRRIERHTVGRGSLIERFYDKNKIWQDCQKGEIDYRRKADFVKSIGIPILELDMTESIETNSEEIIHFIKSIE